MDYKKLSEMLFSDINKTVDYYLTKYKKRDLKPGAEVLRLAPSPTGFLHLGQVFSALMQFIVAKNTGGVFYLRLEDTDTKREVANAGEVAYQTLIRYGIVPDEGYRGEILPETGNYGPYVQTERIEIYKTFAKHLVSIGRAFPCFCEAADHKERDYEVNDGLDDKDKCRDMELSEIEANLKAGKPYAIRLKSKGDGLKIIKIVDLFKGRRMIRENAKDIVLLKSNGIPPYSLAHLVDDTLMHTTKVIRGEEWYASVSAHIELFEACGFKPMTYGHTPVISVNDKVSGHKRKISKRYDPEADMRFFSKAGYPAEAVLEYLLNLINSNFELWRIKNPDKCIFEFPLDFAKVGSNNPYFDFAKLDSISKTIIAKMSSADIYEHMLTWANEFDKEFYEYLIKNKDYAVKVFGIGKNNNRTSKDLAKFSDAKEYFDFMFKAPVCFAKNSKTAPNTSKAILAEYAKFYDNADTKDEWFNKVKTLALKFNFSADIKEFSSNPSNFAGSITDFVTVIRIALTGKTDSPDIYDIMKILGKDEVLRRLKR